MTIATRGQSVPVDPSDGSGSGSGSQTTLTTSLNRSSAEDMGFEDYGMEAESEEAEPDFPHELLANLDHKITSARWVVPVLPNQELEQLMQAAIDLSKKGLDTRSEACQRFFREGLTISFTKILTDDAVNSWKLNIHQCIFQNCEKLIELCVVKLADDWFPLLELLAIVLNPNNKFHTFNANRLSETMPPITNMITNSINAEDDVYARSPSDNRPVRGWLVDLINRFGDLGGFQILLNRFQNGPKLSVPTIYALIRPFGLCYEYLTVNTITKYLMPIVEMVPKILDNLTDDELKKEAKNDSKNDAISSIIKSCKLLVSRVPAQEEMIKNLQIFKLRIILRLLQISTFNGKMSALNEVNKVIGSVSYYPHRHAGLEEEEWLTAERMAKWIKENNVLEIVLRDSMHQIQYVEKLEKILRFIIKEEALTLKDLDSIWAAQAGKHEAIVKNVHDLLAKLAWDFQPEQLDHLFECFQSSWKTADKKQRERLLELIRRLAEDDKDGMMAHKVLMLFWNLAHDDDVPNEIMDQALNAHVKILDYSCSQERDAQKSLWLDKCVDELKSGDKWALPALKQIKEICCLYEAPPNVNHSQRGHHAFYRQEIIEQLQSNHTLVILVTNSLSSYMEKARQAAKDNPLLDPSDYIPDGRFNHHAQVQERLNFLRFLLKRVVTFQDGQLWLCAEQAKQIWQCIAENPAFPSDRETCFRWFSKLMGEDPDLDPGINRDFFENNILQLDPCLLTESGMRCFERFFKVVNIKEGKLKLKRRSCQLDDVDLIGADYLWKVVTNSADDIANRGIELMKDVYTNLGPSLQDQLMDFHENFVSECLCRLRAHYDTIKALNATSKEGDADAIKDRAQQKSEAIKLCRVMKVLQEYISECDSDYNRERKNLPLERYFKSDRGKHLSLIVRFTKPGRQTEDLDISTHTNDTVASLKRQILRRMKLSISSFRIEMSVNSEPLDPSDDRKLLSQIPLRNKTVISAKPLAVSVNMPSSPDSSSDSSTGSPRVPYDLPVTEAENCLPGVIMSKKSSNVCFFFQVADLGIALKNPQLRDGARALLTLVPPDVETVQRLTALFRSRPTPTHTPNPDGEKPSSNCQMPTSAPTCAPPTSAATADEQPTTAIVPGSTAPPGSALQPPPTIENMFFTASPSEVLYNLEVMYSLLMPAVDSTSDKNVEFQLDFIRSRDAPVILTMLTKKNFLQNADVATKRSAYLTLLKMCKLLLGFLVQVINRIPQPQNQSGEPPNPDSQIHAVFGAPEGGGAGTCNRLTMLRRVLLFSNTDGCLSSVASSWGETILQTVLEEISTNYRKGAWTMLDMALNSELPNFDTIVAVMRLAWAASSGNIEMVDASPTELHAMHEDPVLASEGSLEPDDVCVCEEALDVLTFSLVLDPHTLTVFKEEIGREFLIDLLLLCKNRTIRSAAAEQFLLLAVCSPDERALQTCISVVLSVLHTTVKENASKSHEYFQVLCKLLNMAAEWNYPPSGVQHLLYDEIMLLKSIRKNVKETGDPQVDEALLEGHLGIAKELMAFMSPEEKYQLGSAESQGINLIKELVDDFIFPASRVMCNLERTGQLPQDQAAPVCTSPPTINMAFDLLVALCTGCKENLELLVEMLTEMFYSDKQEPLVEWDYLPPVGPRPPKGFVGLKNAGATCYMNSILQQLYMLENIRVGILAAEGAATDLNEDFSGEERMDGESNIEQTENELNDESKSPEEARKEYNIGILKQVQAIFGHLAYSKLQYYVPRGLWKHFKLQGEPVNLREQQDAVEFFNSLVECVDEALKALNQEQIMIKTLGGSYSDQKICKGCPHRYSREESFSVLSVEIRNHPTLLDSLEQYVKGELLEGGDAYHCDKCDKKVVTVKRLCVKRLPPILAIQLKRFEYDYERVCPIKFNDYFEFPRDLDMEPYTVTGLAKMEGEMIDCDYDEISKDTCTKYQLTGIVVHSGQASGGHYYSYILNRQADGTAKWYKFDDGEVTECKMEDEEEMKSQCFGGDYMGEVFDHAVKRISYRRQKRWWNAYMLYYTRLDVEENALMKSLNEISLSDTKFNLMKMPAAIERSVRKQNIKFMHNRNQFSPEYFQFIKKLVSCNSPMPIRPEKRPPADMEALSLASVQMASRFLFHTGFHTKKTLRGPANDWFDILLAHLKVYKSVRSWFAINVLFHHPHRFCEYLLACQSNEVRSAFIKIIVYLAHCSIQDGPCLPPNVNAPVVLLTPSATLSDHLLIAVLNLLEKEVSDHGRNLSHYFSLFHTYAMMGIQERTQLLNLNVPATFMKVATDDGSGPHIKYQCPELTKLHQVVSLLIRCCDVSSRCKPFSGQQILENPYAEPSCPEYIMPIQPAAIEFLYNRTSYVKKLVEDANMSEDILELLQFCCWENPVFSCCVQGEVLWQIAYTYCHDMHQYMNLLLALLLMEDSWQVYRISSAIKGGPDDHESLLATINRSKTHYQKRAYHCIKCLVLLFTKCDIALNELKRDPEIRRNWQLAVEWLHDELERRPFAPNSQYNYNNWSPPTHSNETANGFFLERSNSARKTLDKARELCDFFPEEDAAPEMPQEDRTSHDSQMSASGGNAGGHNMPQDGLSQDLANRAERAYVKMFQTNNNLVFEGSGRREGESSVRSCNYDFTRMQDFGDQNNVVFDRRSRREALRDCSFDFSRTQDFGDQNLAVVSANVNSQNQDQPQQPLDQQRQQEPKEQQQQQQGPNEDRLSLDSQVYAGSKKDVRRVDAVSVSLKDVRPLKREDLDFFYSKYTPANNNVVENSDCLEDKSKVGSCNPNERIHWSEEQTAKLSVRAKPIIGRQMQEKQQGQEELEGQQEEQQGQQEPVSQQEMSSEQRSAILDGQTEEEQKLRDFIENFSTRKYHQHMMDQFDKALSPTSQEQLVERDPQRDPQRDNVSESADPLSKTPLIVWYRDALEDEGGRLPSRKDTRAAHARPTLQSKAEYIRNISRRRRENRALYATENVVDTAQRLLNESSEGPEGTKSHEGLESPQAPEGDESFGFHVGETGTGQDVDQDGGSAPQDVDVEKVDLTHGSSTDKESSDLATDSSSSLTPEVASTTISQPVSNPAAPDHTKTFPC